MSKVPSKIRLDKLLLGPDYYNKNIRKPREHYLTYDIATELFGQEFQKKLRLHKHKTDDSYKCSTCNATGLLTQPTTTNLDNFITDMTELALYEADQLALNVLIKEGFAPTGAKPTKILKSGKVKKYAATTGVFNELLKKTKKLKAKIREESDTLRGKNALIDDPKKVKQLTDQLVSKLNNEYFGLFATCPICNGSGYYDIGHESFIGKQSELLLIVFTTRIKGKEHPDWTATISKSRLEKMFMTLKVTPEIPRVLNRGKIQKLIDDEVLYISEIAELTTNQYTYKTKVAAELKVGAYLQIQSFYETGQHTSKYIVTYEQVLNFFLRLTKSARVKSGKLKEKLANQIPQLRRGLIVTRKALGTKKETPYTSKYLVVDGSTASEANTKNDSLYVYAERFVSPKLWSKDKGKTTIDIEREAFGKSATELGFQIKYFPQRAV